MKRSLATGIVLLCVMLGLFFGSALFRYATPMSDVSYDLSLMWEGEGVPDDYVYDQKGWTVFCQEGDQITELIADGYGQFYGAIEPNQVFYYSRKLTEELDQPMLRINAYSYSIAVFVDDELIYSDALSDDARIGSLELPELGWERTAPINLKLPGDYLGKTLTIAQNAGYNELQSEPFRVFLRPMTLYCGYASESALISESFSTAIPAAWFFAAGLALLVVFAISAWRGRWHWPLFCAALSALLWMLGELADTSFFPVYQGETHVDIAFLCRCFALSVLLIFFACRAGRLRIIPWTFAILNALSSVIVLVIEVLFVAFPNDLSVFLYYVPFQLTGFFGLLAIWSCAWFAWRNENRFYRLFAPLMTVGTAAVMLGDLLFHNNRLFMQLHYALTEGTPAYFLWPLMLVATICAIIAVGVELTEQEIARRTEARQFAQRSQMALESYENIRRQYEQVMMIRHDFTKHLRMLRLLTKEDAAAAYLDELIGENQKIPVMVQCGNQMIDMILNSKFAAAKDTGIDVQIGRMNAPKTLPLSDAELCSLVMNLLDNAVNAASDPTLHEPFIRLDMHVKGRYFVFCLENSAVPENDDKKTMPEHGLGLKIIKRVMDRHEENLMEVEHRDNSYQVTLGIFLD